MTILYSFALCLLAANIQGNQITGRIYGGKEGSDGEFPYVIFHIQQSLTKGYDTCTGGLISRNWVLTAAHCLDRQSNPEKHLAVAGKANIREYLTARLGEIPFDNDIEDDNVYGVQERRIAAVFYHPGYAASKTNDIGLMRVKKPFVYNNRVSSLPMPKSKFEARNDCFSIGYGSVDKGDKYNVQYLSGVAAKPGQSCKIKKSRDLICLVDTKRGVCKGDSGGPLVCGNAIRGVAAFEKTDEKTCGKGVKEQYYTDVQRNLDWIVKILNDSK